MLESWGCGACTIAMLWLPIKVVYGVISAGLYCSFVLDIGLNNVT
jgi:hypothetical protein